MPTPIENNTTSLEELLSEVEKLPPAPSGTTEITENGNHDVSRFAMASVNVPGGGGASTWDQLQHKPFSTIGSGLTVEGDVLKATGSGDITDDEAIDFAYELGFVEPLALSGYTLLTDKEGCILTGHPAPPPPPIPEKGDIIFMNLGTRMAYDIGLGINAYRVLKVNGNIALVMAMYEAYTASEFSVLNHTIEFSNGIIGQEYRVSDLDRFLERTVYPLLNADAHRAIVLTPITQDMWWVGEERPYQGNPTYEGVAWSSEQDHFYGIGNMNGVAPIGSRYCFALSMSEVIDYLTSTGDGTLSYENLWKMFWNTTSIPTQTGHLRLWLRSAFCDDSSQVSCIDGYCGRLDSWFSNSTSAVRPAFYIDLSKIDWTPANS